MRNLDKYAPLYRAVSGYAAKKQVRLHTPGHAGKQGAFPFMQDAVPFDVTELPWLDSLMEADGPIYESELLAAGLFRSAHTFYSAGGNTLCIQTMLAMIPGGGRVAMPRSCVHRSAVYACALLGLEPVFFLPRGDSNTYDPADIEDLICRQQLSALYLTSPDYYGRLANIEELSAVCRRLDVPLLVDNAHGTHLAFASPSLHPLHLGADLTADSAHKTLPVMTGGALLQVGGRMAEQFLPRARPAMALFGSTSPSYPVLLSLERACAWLQTDGRQAYERLALRVMELRGLAAQRGFTFPDWATDPIRLTLNGGALGLTGHRLAALLREQGLEPEWANERYCVLLPSPLHDEADFARLTAAIEQVGGCAYGAPVNEMPVLPRELVRALPLREAMTAKTRLLPIEQAAGQVAAQLICRCPPGVPLVVPGETMDQIAAAQLLSAGFSEIKVVQ